MSLIYLNHAATSYPKPPEVVAAVQQALSEPPADRSRGGNGHDLRGRCRQLLGMLLGVAEPDRIVLLPSATYALNLVVHGLVDRGSHVVTTVLEHSSLLRPLAHRARALGVQVEHLPPGPDGRIDPAAIGAAITSRTALVAVTHAANVTGAVQPMAEVAEVAAAADVPLLIDAAQTAGAVAIDHGVLPGRVFVAFAGHKGLLGPPGTGGLVLPDNRLAQLTVGGTGVRSERTLHPEELPLRHEAGTPNLPGIAGLAAGTGLVLARGVAAEGAHRNRLVHLARDGLARLGPVRLLPLAGNDGRAGIVCFTRQGWSPESLAHLLREVYSIETRAGLHCAPLAHQHLGTAPAGTVRASFACSSTADDAAALVDAVASIGEA